MASRLFDTYHADDDEIAGVKNALDAASIPHYETHKGFWGMGSAGIWVSNNDDYITARKVVDAFQLEWQQKVRDEVTPTGIRWARLPVLIVVGGIVLYLNLFWFFLD